MVFPQSILIVDDETNLRATLTLILQRAGYSVYAVASGREALQCMVDNHFNLLFLDLRMPGIDGLQLLPEIRRLDPNVPVLILTANASLQVAVEALRLGAYGYILKPVEPEKLISRVGEIFQEQQREKQRQQIVKEIREIISELDELEIYDGQI